MKKISFLILIGMFAVYNVSAQRDLTKFLGNWTLTNAGGTKMSKLPQITLNVSHVGDKIQIEKLSKDLKSSNALSQIDLYKDNEVSYVELSDSPKNSILRRQMNYLKPDKISFDKISEYGLGTNAHIKRLEREIWRVSPDGKTLTIEGRTEDRNISNDTVASPLNQSSSSSVKWTFEKN